MRSESVGCLLIDDPTPGGSGLSGLSSWLGRAGLNAVDFSCQDGGRLLERLREAYYAARQGCLSGALIGRGAGCWAALALAEQLPASRLVLIDACRPEDVPGLTRPVRAQLARLAAFARRNLSFCVADVLEVALDGPRGARILPKTLPNARISRLRIGAMGVKTRESELFPALYSYLVAGELPKSLAENPEMCIIYG